MFELLRKMIGPIMLLVLIAFIFTIIFSWGGGGFQEKPKDTVGVIDGENIPIAVYSRYYSNLYRQEQEKTEEDIPPEKEKEIRDQAWSQLVADFLINREVEKRNISISSEELYEYLKMYPPQIVQQAPQFMTDGKFDRQKYMGAMISPDNAPFWAQLEAMVTPELKRGKLQAEILSTVRVLPSEVMESFLAENEKIKVGFINVASDPFETIAKEPSLEEMQAYYDSHKEEYKLRERATIDLVVFDKVPSENDWQRVYAQAKDIYDSAIAGADFAELAEIFSEDASASSGGDLGWFERGRMVPEFDSATWSLTVNEISKPVRSRFGWHIIKLLGVKEEMGTPRGSDKPQMMEKRNAAHILFKVVPSQETLEGLSSSATEFADEAKNVGLKQAAETYNYEVKTTTPFYKNGYISYIGIDLAVNNFAFEKEVGTVSDMMETENLYFVISVASHLPEEYTAFDQAKASITTKLRKQNAKKMAMDTARVMYDDIIAGNSFNNTAKKYGYIYGQSEMFNRNGLISGIGRAPEVIGAAFGLQNINGITPPVEYDRGAAILTLLDKQSASLEVFNQKQDSLHFAVQLKKSQDAYGRWFENLTKNAKVVSYVDQFYSNN
ncbi:MAG: hypothetical protein CVT49_03800 [candidate division Zixibacteria bacterium HGW-Zixibacteria-1]|nr:MAG: hypothetical protein CVT49_03800 [candidate division Zixibacteria bacterium HGW-Zixibacteria-1]